MLNEQAHTTLNAISRQWQPVYHALTTNRILDGAIQVQQIAAPTFEEQARADYVERRFRALRLQHISRDTLHNVLGWINSPRQHQLPIILVSAHTDTVFPTDTDLSITKRGTYAIGPGIGDNSLGVAVLLLLAEIFAGLKNDLPVCLGFVANSREEGLGNLDGIRAVVENLPADRIAGCIVLEGMALGRVYHGGIAVRRLKISAETEGGHSWLHFGQPSATHVLSRVCASISHLDVPTDPRTTYNIGMIEGGHSINSIAASATAFLDMRSETTDGLARLEAKVRKIVKGYRQPDVKLDVEVIGDRPAGYLSQEHPLIQMALAAQHHIGLEPILDQGSTDANVLYAHGIPAVVVGVTHGGNAHRLDEFIDTGPLRDGVWSVVLLLATLVDQFR